MINWEHVLGLSIVGAGGLIALATNHIELAATLLGAVGGYAFKNGLVNR